MADCFSCRKSMKCEDDIYLCEVDFTECIIDGQMIAEEDCKNYEEE